MNRLLKPAVRRYLYALTAAALAFASAVGWVPGPTAIAAAPLLVAIFYVTPEGEPK